MCLGNISGDFSANNTKKHKCVEHDSGVNESKALTKHMPCKCKLRFDERKCNSDQQSN